VQLTEMTVISTEDSTCETKKKKEKEKKEKKSEHVKKDLSGLQ